MRWQVLAALIGAEVVYLLLGGLVFRALESRAPPDAADDVIDDDVITRPTLNLTLLISSFVMNNTCVALSELEGLMQIVITTSLAPASSSSSSSSSSNWDLAGSIFFAMTVVSTIGYGNLVPSTGSSRAFCCVYALCGIPLTLVMMIGIGECLNELASRLDNRILRRRPRVGKVARSLFIFAVGFALFVLLPAAGFRSMHGWSYGVAVYYCIITLTTVGFGDYVAGFGSGGYAYRIAVGVWIYVGLAWLSGFMTSLQDSFHAVVQHVDSQPAAGACLDSDKKSEAGAQPFEGCQSSAVTSSTACEQNPSRVTHQLDDDVTKDQLPSDCDVTAPLRRRMS